MIAHEIFLFIENFFYFLIHKHRIINIFISNFLYFLNFQLNLI